ncbi:uncharacterized protein LOC126366430 [Pectinophora gossypiella]|uniref:uncharacterized protein LOC126366430 n=1 Tax=Pectinophora gossypiella TaxID=13191 RepID=UPI00214F3A99|nr:uncharacterized protein LOC126366430 [Pectinophora gossypiella]
MIQKLNLEYHAINEKYEHLSNFIELGYKELKKIRNEQVHTNDLPVIMQLKEIMLCCGQYYADHRNEHEKCVQLEQKNRYLTNKLSILEANLEGLTEELKKYQRCPKSKPITTSTSTGKKNKADSRKIGYVCSEYKFGSQVNVSRVTLESDSSHKEDIQKPLCKVESLDLTSHISLVNNLLTDQDIMLKDLKALAEELGTIDSQESNN